jgi:hypothetical protein
MANKAVAKNKSDQALALPDELDLPQGAGLEDADRDSYAIPFLAILQKTSPQVDPDHEGFIEGAKTGMFFDTVAQEFMDADAENIEIIPVYYRRAFVEWKLRDDGGGFVGEHSVEDAAGMKWERTDKGDVLPNGNGIVDTRYHYVIVLREGHPPQAMVITMSSTQVKKSKRLCSDMDLQVRALGLKATFQTKYKIVTVGESNEHGTWRGWNITRAGLVDDQEQLNSAINFYKAIKSGEVKEATDSLDPTGAAGDGTDPTF